MGLRAKLNLLVVLAALLGVALFAVVSTPFLERNAKDEVVERARIMMLSAAGARKFTAERVAPILLVQMQEQFHPEAVASVAAVANFDVLRKTFSDYSYREPALNPTNLAARATDWEADIINYFRSNDGQTELISERQTPTGQILNLAQPIVATANCLACHGKWQDAPPSLIEAYGNQNGFGWLENEVVAAQIVSVPMSVALNNASETRLLFIGLLTGVSFILVVLLNSFMHFMILRPVQSMTEVASKVSMGETNVPEYVRKGRDEISELSASFNRVRRSMEEAMKLLKSS